MSLKHFIALSIIHTIMIILDLYYFIISFFKFKLFSHTNHFIYKDISKLKHIGYIIPEFTESHVNSISDLISFTLTLNTHFISIFLPKSIYLHH